MSKYSREKKQIALALMSAPEKLSVPEVSVRTGVSKATKVGMSVRTYERWVWDGEVRADARPAAERPASTHKLTEAEREPSHCMAPTYPTLACPRVGSVYLRA